jgi:hypothetical protein
LRRILAISAREHTLYGTKISGGIAMDEFRIPLIGESAPAFKANTTYGPINFPENYKGKWVVFFSHPGDLPRAAG